MSLLNCYLAYSTWRVAVCPWVNELSRQWMEIIVLEAETDLLSTNTKQFIYMNIYPLFYKGGYTWSNDTIEIHRVRHYVDYITAVQVSEAVDGISSQP